MFGQNLDVPSGSLGMFLGTNFGCALDIKTLDNGAWCVSLKETFKSGTGASGAIVSLFEVGCRCIFQMLVCSSKEAGKFKVGL